LAGKDGKSASKNKIVLGNSAKLKVDVPAKSCWIRDFYSNKEMEADTIEEFSSYTDVPEFSFYSGAVVSGADCQDNNKSLASNKSAANALRYQRKLIVEAVYKLLVEDVTLIAAPGRSKAVSMRNVTQEGNNLASTDKGKADGEASAKNVKRALKEDKSKRKKVLACMHSFATEAGLFDADTLTAFIYGLIIMDLGKVEHYAHYVTINSSAFLSANYLHVLGAATELSMALKSEEEKTHENALQKAGEEYGRDNVYRKRFEIHEVSGLSTDSFLPSFGDVTTNWQFHIRAIFATEFLLIQFVQCELSPASLMPLECWVNTYPHTKNLDNEDRKKERKKVFHFFLLMQVFNIIGSDGKVTVKMWDLLSEYLKILLKFCDGTEDEGELGEKCIEIYNQGLVHMAGTYLKTERLVEFLGVDVEHRKSTIEKSSIQNLLLEDKELYALSRLAAMCMAHTDVDTRIVACAFRALTEEERKILITELCKNGIVDGYAIHLFHAPKMLQNIMSLHKTQNGMDMMKKQESNVGSMQTTERSEEKTSTSGKHEKRDEKVEEGRARERMKHGFSILSEAYRQSRELLSYFLHDVKYDDGGGTVALQRPQSRNDTNWKRQAGALSKNQRGVFDVSCYALSLCPPTKLYTSKIDIRINWSVEQLEVLEQDTPPNAVCTILHKW